LYGVLSAKKLSKPVNEGPLSSCLLGAGFTDFFISKVKEGLGLENLTAFTSGGAPLSPETQEFISKVLAPVAQGYGATETTGATTCQEIISSDGRPVDESRGGVGSLIPSVELKLKSVPDMGYLVTDNPPRGEILLAGNSVSQGGYFGMPEKSQEDFPKHSDGKKWFHTGDIGVMTETGALKIVDRKKDLIKLSGGEYVSLGKVEAGLKQVPGIGAVAVFARSDKDHCVCIVSQPEKHWASVGGKPQDEAKLVKDIEIELRKQGMARFEIPTKVKLDDTVWTADSGLVTASMKVQRNPIRQYYNQAGGLLAQMDYQFPAN
jgi:long-chain acyl-CoA synthetase